MSDWQPPPPGADKRLPPMQEEQPSQPQHAPPPGQAPGPTGPAGQGWGLGPPEPEPAPGKRSSTRVLLFVAFGAGGLLFLVAGAVVVWKLLSGGEEPARQAAAAPTGTLVVASSPEEATVRLGEEVLGTTPLSRDIAPGQHDVHVVKKGHEPYDETVTLEKDGMVTVTAQLEKKLVVESDETGKLTLETKPTAEVYVNEELLGETPLDEVDVPAGVVPLELELDSGERVVRAVYVKANDVTKTYIDLTSGQ